MTDDIKYFKNRISDLTKLVFVLILLVFLDVSKVLDEVLTPDEAEKHLERSINDEKAMIRQYNILLNTSNTEHQARFNEKDVSEVYVKSYYSDSLKYQMGLANEGTLSFDIAITDAMGSNSPEKIMFTLVKLQDAVARERALQKYIKEHTLTWMR